VPLQLRQDEFKLETMSPGQVLLGMWTMAIPSQCPPQRNNEGHDILSQGKAEQSYRVMIRKRLDD
jgi:tRNA 2-thiouridine synthesizing protein A